MRLRTEICNHLEDFDPDTIKVSKAYECAECVKTGDQWVHLRTCQQCGITLCCDSSPKKHASKHYEVHNDHPVVISAEPGENWAWCYQHKSFVQF